MTIKDNLTRIYERLYREKKALYLGYNVGFGSKMYGTLSGIPDGGTQEMPCAENLIAGAGIGIALEGTRLPVLCFERHEFMLFALGMVAAMGDKFHLVTGVRVPMIVRAIKGAEKPLDPGAQHKTNYSMTIRLSCSNSYVLSQDKLKYEDIISGLAKSKSGIVIILEDRDGYDNEYR